MTDAQLHEDLETGDTDADAFLNLWSEKDASLRPSEDEGDEDNRKKKPAPPKEDEGSDEDAAKPSEEEHEEDEGETEETHEDDEESKDKSERKTVEDDDVVFKIKVGDEEHEVPAKDLKRLYGQEKALTQKGMEIAATRKQLEDQGARHIAAAEGLKMRAEARLKQFEGIDWVQAVVKLDPQEYQALRASAGEAWQDYQFYTEGLDSYLKQAQDERHNALVNEARQSLKELGDPNTGIKGFNKDLYNEMRSFAMEKGISEAQINQIVSAPALRLIHMAMMYEKGQSAVSKTTKVVKTPKKIVKSSAATNTKDLKDKSSKAYSRLKESGEQDDAEAAFYERFTRGSRDDD